MPVRSENQYELKDLYQEIDLFDRKIAHCQNFEKFDSEPARAAALKKLVTRREALVKAALAMTGHGVECDPQYLPRSFKTEAETEKVKP